MRSSNFKIRTTKDANTKKAEEVSVEPNEDDLITSCNPEQVISKAKKELLVVELKKGRSSDNVVGQIQRYMGYVQEELAKSNQIVKAIIIAPEDDIRIRRALAVTMNIEFYRYQVSFKLVKS